MRKTINFLILFFSFTCTAQDLDYLKSQDTIYVVLPSLHDTVPKKMKFRYSELYIASNKIITEYTFTDLDTFNHQVSALVRLNPAKPNSDLPVEVNKKKFFRKKKKQVVGLNFIGKYRNREFFFKYLGLKGYGKGNKVIYIIEEESLKRKDKNIILRKADLVSFGYIGI